MAGKRGGMSAAEYTRCDNPECGRLAPYPPEDTIYHNDLG